MVKPREKRVPIMMSEDEMKAVDDWRFENRVATRSEAIRRLCQIAIELERPVAFNAALAVAFSKGTDEAFEKMLGRLNDPATSEDGKQKQIAATRGWFRTSANHLLQRAGVLVAIAQAYRLPGDAASVFKAAKEKSEQMQSLNDPLDKTFDEILRSVFPGLDLDGTKTNDT